MLVVGGVHGDRLARPQRRRDVLGNGEVHVGRGIDTLEGGQLGAFVQVLAGMDVGESDAGPERRANRLTGDDSPAAGDLRRGDVARRAGLLDFLFRRGLSLAQAQHPSERRRGEVGLGGLGLEVRLFHRDVEGDQHGAGLDHPSGGEHDLVHRPRQLVAQGDRVQGQDRPDRRRRGPIQPLLRHGRRDGGHRLRLAGGRRIGSADGGVFPRRQHGPRHDQGQQQSGRPEPTAVTRLEKARHTSFSSVSRKG